MLPKHFQLVRKSSQRGSMLMLAIFIMVVMLLLGSALVRILSTGNETLAYEVIGTRAYNAANSGLQAKLAEIFPLNSLAVQCDGASPIASLVDGADPTTIPELVQDNYLPNINNVSGLANCEVDIRCHNFKQDNITYYTVESTGECDLAGGEATSRTIRVEARSLD